MKSHIVFAEEKLKKEFNKLKSSKNKNLYSWINSALDVIETNAFCGIQIPKKLIPKEYIKKYNIDNLWKYDLPSAWRLLYSVQNSEIIIISIVIEWLDHKDYERRFKY